MNATDVQRRRTVTVPAREIVVGDTVLWGGVLRVISHADRGVVGGNVRPGLVLLRTADGMEGWFGVSASLKVLRP